MTQPMSAAQVLDREFLEVRARILELAAAFDRLQRAAGNIENDPRLQRIAAALAALGENTPDRAEQVQLIFSRAYDDDWREKLRLAPSR